MRIAGDVRDVARLPAGVRPESGQRRLYYLKPGESRAPEPALLAQQFERAEFLPTEAPHSPAADPR